MSTKRAVLIVLSQSRTRLHFMLNKLPRIKPALSLLEGQLPIVNISTIPTPNAFEFLLREQACEAVLYCNVDKTELQGPFITCSLDKLNIPQLWHSSWTPESRGHSSHSKGIRGSYFSQATSYRRNRRQAFSFSLSVYVLTFTAEYQRHGWQ